MWRVLKGYRSLPNNLSFVLEIYKLSQKFPKSELYGLTSQIRRAAISIPANIVEGFKRRGKNDKLRFLNIAQSSLVEVHYYLILCHDLGYGDTEKFLEQINEIGKILESYSNSILNSNS